MESGGHVRSFRHGREKVYAIHRPDWFNLIKWKTNIENENSFPEWINWAALFGVIERFFCALGDPELAEQSIAKQAVLVRDLLIENSPSFVRSGVAQDIHSRPGMKGGELVEACDSRY